MMGLVHTYSEQEVWDMLSKLPDPEIPVISIVELGVVRKVNLIEHGVEVIITPTYSGCPAMKMIEDDIRSTLLANEFKTVEITTTFSPPWTTDWIPEEAREKLRKYGIAPPEKGSLDKNDLIGGKPRACPRCGSMDTSMKSQFGSTPCKALFTCDDCLEPFDYFKCI